MSALQYVSEIQALLIDHHKLYQSFSTYPVITRSVLQLNRRYSLITNTALAVWITQQCRDELPIYVTDLLDDIDGLVRQKAISGGWRRFISLRTFAEIEHKLARYKTLQRYGYADRLFTVKKPEMESCEDLPQFDSLVVIKKRRTLLRHCLLLQPPQLEPEYWDLFTAVLNKEAILYQLPKPNYGVLAFQVFRDPEHKMKGLRFLCAKPKYNEKFSFNVLDEMLNGLKEFQSKTDVKIDYEHPWF